MSPEPEPAAPARRFQSLGKILLGLCISLVFLGLIFYRLDWRLLLATLARIKPGWTLVAAGLTVASYFLRGLLWRVLIGRRHRARLWNLFRIITLGYLANNLLPLKLGEVLRAWLLSKFERLPTSLAIGTLK